MKFIEKYKSPNFDRRKKASSLNYIIIHYTAIKSYKEALSHLCKKENKASTHFFISKSGEIFHLVDIEISNFRVLRTRYRDSVFLRARARAYAETGISLALPNGSPLLYDAYDKVFEICRRP